MKEYYSLAEIADLLSVSKETLRRWDKAGKLKPIRHPMNDYRVYPADSLRKFEALGFMFDDDKKHQYHNPIHKFRTIELFAGAGGLALGLENAGLECVLLNELDKDACKTLKFNRPDWKVIEGDVRNIDFTKYRNEVDVVAGGFPCQAFSYAVYIVIINQYLKMEALKVTFYSMLFCTITIFIHSFFEESSNIMPLINFNMWFYTLFLALIPTIISLLFLIKSIQIIGSTTASILGALEPLTAVMIGVLIFEEKLSLDLIIGIFLILFGVSLIVLKNYFERLLKIRD